MEFVKTYFEFLKQGLSRLEADVIAYVGMFDKGCYQTNNVIAANLVSSANRIRVVINHLVSDGWLISKIDKEKGNERTLYITDKSANVMNITQDPMIKNDHTYDQKRSDPMIKNDHTYDQKRSDPMIKNDHTYDQKRSDPMIKNDHTYDQNRSPYFINRKLIENIKENGIDLCSADSKNLAAEPTHTPPPQTDFSSEKNLTENHTEKQKRNPSQLPDVPDAETIAEIFISNRPDLTRDVAVTEATKFRNYYLSHPNRCPENNFWNGLIGNWLMNDRDKLFAKNSLGEKEQEPYYKRKYGQVDHAAFAKWFFDK